MTSIRCTTHHHACKCREEKFRELEAKYDSLLFAARTLYFNAERDSDISVVDDRDLANLGRVLRDKQ